MAQAENTETGKSMPPVKHSVSFLPVSMSAKKRTAHRPLTNPRADWSWGRLMVDSIISRGKFKLLLAGVMTLNVVLVVMETDLEANGEKLARHWKTLGLAFLFVYVLELALQVYVHRCEFFKDALHVMDAVIIISDLTTELIGSFGLRLSVFRLVRLLSMVRSMRGSTAYKELYVMIQGFLGTAKAILWSTLLLVFLLTLFSIFTVQMIHPLVIQLADEGQFVGCDRCARAYSSVMQSNLSYFQGVVAGDSWGVVTVPIMERWPWTALIFVPALLVLDLGLMNLVMKVIVDSAASHRDAESELSDIDHRQELEKTKARLGEMCKEMDKDNSGELSISEIVAGYDNDHDFKATLNAMEVNREDLLAVFSILDEDESGSITAEEFIDAVFKMKTEDSHTLLVFIKSYVCDLRQKISIDLAKLEAEMKELRSQHSDLVNMHNQVLKESQGYRTSFGKGAPKQACISVQSGDVQVTQSSAFGQELAVLRSEILQRFDQQAAMISQAWAIPHGSAGLNGTSVSRPARPSTSEKVTQRIPKAGLWCNPGSLELRGAANPAFGNNRPLSGHAGD